MPVADVVSTVPEYVLGLLRAVIIVWLLAVGGCIGSFLNVVIYRLPAGDSIVRGGSRCPRCRHAIRWYDNIPVVSWLVLRGRCRYCAGAIPARYLGIELLVAGISVALGLAEGVSGGTNLPLQRPGSWRFGLAPLTVWSFYVYHLTLIATLVAAAVIRRDGYRIPQRLYGPALLIGLTAPWLEPRLLPVPVLLDASGSPRLVALTSTVAGLGMGLVLAVLVLPLFRRRESWSSLVTAVLLPAALVGLFLGWQAAVLIVPVVTVAWTAVHGGALLLGRRHRVPWAGYLAVAALLLILNWQTLVQECTLCKLMTTWPGAGMTLLAVFGWAWIGRLFVPPDVLPAGRDRTQRGEIMAAADRDENLNRILRSPTYALVEEDPEFIRRPELRAVRVQLEYLKPELVFKDQQIESTIVVFGGTQVVERQEAEYRLKVARAQLAKQPGDPVSVRTVERAERILAKAHYYQAARDFGQLVSTRCQVDHDCNYVIVTGGGPGIMEAANRGAADVQAKSIGLNVTLPEEQAPNPYITPELCFQFHYFAMRKMHFLKRARALVVFPGGFGTLDELFDALTLRQTQRMQDIPIILFGREYWRQAVDFPFLANEGVIADRDLQLLSYAETPEEAWEIIVRFHGVGD